MTGILHYNFETFADEANRLRTEGFYVFNPAEADLAYGFNPIGCHGKETKAELAGLGFNLQDALTMDLTFIAQEAEVVVVLPGWEKSKGVAAEIALADALGIPVVKAGSMFTDRKYNDIEYDLLRAEDVSPKDPKLPELANALAVESEAWQEIMDGGAKLTTSETGGQKGAKEARYDLIPVKPLEYLARLYGRGAEKYEDNNWAYGYDWKLSYAAMQRHANQFWGGEDLDPEMNLPHLASVAWHAFTMLYFMENHPQYDSRLKEVPTKS